jgi:hypothetical protein
LLLGRSRATLSRWSHRPGFPANTLGKRLLCNPAEVRAWAERAGIWRDLQPSAAAAPASAPAKPISAHAAAQAKVLADPAATDLDRARAAFALACSTLASATLRDEHSGQAFQAVSKASEELRRAEAAHLDLQERRGQLVGRDVAQAVAGGLAGRLVGVLNNFDSGLAAQLEVWIGDARFRDLPTDERARQVRAWSQTQTRSLRELEANAIEALIAEKVVESEGAA